MMVRCNRDNKMRTRYRRCVDDGFVLRFYSCTKRIRFRLGMNDFDMSHNTMPGYKLVFDGGGVNTQFLPLFTGAPHTVKK